MNTFLRAYLGAALGFMAIVMPQASLAKLVHLPVVTGISWQPTLITRTSYSPVLMEVPDAIANKEVPFGGRFVTTYVRHNQQGGGIGKGFYATMNSVYSDSDYSFGRSISGETFAEYAERLYQAGEFQGSTIHGWSWAFHVDVCVGFVMNTYQIDFAKTGDTIQEAYANTVSYAYYPIQSICAETPPMDQYCNVESPTLDFNFGTLIASHATGVSLTKEIMMRCTKEANIGVLEGRGGKVSLSNGGTVALTNNGKPLDGSYLNQIPPDTSTAIPLTATITSPGSAGAFTGTAVLLFSFP